MLDTGTIFPSLRIAEPISNEDWAHKVPIRGDHIRVDRGMYTHHGIYLNDDEIIHFSSINDDNLLGTDNSVLRVSLEGFLRSGKLEVKVYSHDDRQDLFPVEEIVNWARACLGDDGYNLIFNNCEHFANYCTLGRHHSHQVSKILGGKIGMGWLGNVWNAMTGGGGGSSRNSSSTTTTYEPDKVKVAEIEANSRVKLAGMEQDRIKLYTDSQLELVEFNAKMEAAVIEARVHGEQALQESIIGLMREANVLAEQRLKLIETAGMDVIRQIDGYYDQLIQEINKNDFLSLIQNLPQLLGVLGQFEQGSPEHTIYFSEIQDYRRRHNDFISEQIKSHRERQSQVLASWLVGKEQVNAHINLLVEKRIEQIGMSLTSKDHLQLPESQRHTQMVASQLQIEQ